MISSPVRFAMPSLAAALAFPLAVIATPASAETARDILTGAAFASPSKPAALASIDRALKSADAALARNPGDREARLQKSLAISYRGMLTRSRSDLATSRKGFEALVAADPRNAEAQMALAGWHLGGVIELGSLVARTMLGASKTTGMKALDRAVALGGDRASFPALAALHRIQLDTGDIAGARRLAEAAVQAESETPLDRMLQKQSATLLASLRKGNGKASAKLAELLLPFGRLK